TRLVAPGASPPWSAPTRGSRSRRAPESRSTSAARTRTAGCAALSWPAGRFAPVWPDARPLDGVRRSFRSRAALPSQGIDRANRNRQNHRGQHVEDGGTLPKPEIPEAGLISPPREEVGVIAWTTARQDQNRREGQKGIERRQDHDHQQSRP